MHSYYVEIEKNISDEDILKLNLTTGKPLIFEIDKDLNVVSSPDSF